MRLDRNDLGLDPPRAIDTSTWRRSVTFSSIQISGFTG
jgi:hypothetical protein